MVSINGSPCADLTYPQVIQLMERVTDSLQMLVKRYAGVCSFSRSWWGPIINAVTRILVIGGESGCSAGGLCGYAETTLVTEKWRLQSPEVSGWLGISWTALVARTALRILVGYFKRVPGKAHVPNMT